VAIDPDVENLRAADAYQNAAFAPRRSSTGDGLAALMIFAGSRGANLARSREP